MRSRSTSSASPAAALLAIVLAAPPALADARLEPDRIEPGGPILFASGGADLLPESYPVLDRVAALLRANPTVTVEVQVHSDSTGSEAFNLTRSAQRAAAIVAYLVQQHGVPQSRLSAQGYGEVCPIAPNTTAEGRAANRRVVFYRTDTNLPRVCPVPPPPPPDPSSQFPDPDDARRQLPQ